MAARYSRRGEVAGSIDGAEAGCDLQFLVVFEPIELIEFGLDDLASVGGGETITHGGEHERGGDDRRGADQERHVRVGVLYSFAAT